MAPMAFLISLAARKKHMKTQFHIRGLKENASLRERLQKPLEQLESHIPISAAVVVLEHNSNTAPAFRADVLIAIPGPDIHANARDCTLEAVWLKVTSALHKQIHQRKFRQKARMKSNWRIRDRNIQLTRNSASRS